MMTSRDFAYWLQGFFEISGTAEPLTGLQIKLIKDHLAMVFVHEIDPSMGSVLHQNELNDIHNQPGTPGSDITYKC